MPVKTIPYCPFGISRTCQRAIKEWSLHEDSLRQLVSVLAPWVAVELAAAVRTCYGRIMRW